MTGWGGGGGGDGRVGGGAFAEWLDWEEDEGGGWLERGGSTDGGGLARVVGGLA